MTKKRDGIKFIMALMAVFIPACANSPDYAETASVLPDSSEKAAAEAASEDPMADLKYSIKRVDQSIDENGNICEIFYDQVVIEGTDEITEKINSYIQEDMSAFFSDMAEMGNLELKNGDYSEDHLLGTCELGDVFNGDDYFGVMLYKTWYMGGVGYKNPYAYTFDKKTGQIVYIDQVLGINEDETNQLYLKKLKETTGANSRQVEAFDNWFQGQGIESYHFYIDSEGMINIFFGAYESGYNTQGEVIPLGSIDDIQSIISVSEKEEQDTEEFDITEYYWYFGHQSIAMYEFSEDGRILQHYDSLVYHFDLGSRDIENCVISQDHFKTGTDLGTYSFSNGILQLNWYETSEQIKLFDRQAAGVAEIEDPFVRDKIESYNGKYYFCSQDWTIPDTYEIQNATYFLSAGKKGIKDEKIENVFPIYHPIGYITILVDNINIRSWHSTDANAGSKAMTGEVYPVFEIVSEEGYTWYNTQEWDQAWIADDNGQWVNFEEN